MKALILCAGFGLRLKPLTDSQAKCMVNITGKPCLERILDHLSKHGITEVVINVHWFAPQIMQYFGTKLLYFYETELLGEKETERLLQPWLGDKYIVCNGDTLTDLDVGDLIKQASTQTIESWSGVTSEDAGVYTGTKVVVKGTTPKKVFTNCYWQDIGTPEGLEKAREHYEKK